MEKKREEREEVNTICSCTLIVATIVFPKYTREGANIILVMIVIYV